MARKLKSGIIGQAQVIFGGAIRMELGWVKSARGKELAIGMAELKHPAAKAGDPIIDEDTYNGTQVTLVFPDFGALNSFRYILDLSEAELKKRIAERDAQQKIDFDDADPSHLVHEHIDPPTFEEAQGEQKPADKVEPKFKVGDKIRKKTPSSFDRDMQVARIEKDYYVCNHIGKFSSEVVSFSKESSYELIEQKPTWSEEDKRKMDRIYSILRQAADTHAFSTSCRLIGDAECIELQNFLKSLKDKVGYEANCTTMWKPSDAQMARLKEACDEHYEIDGLDPLYTLYEQLKKLREE